jgi:hypothetical protein
MWLGCGGRNRPEHLLSANCEATPKAPSRLFGPFRKGFSRNLQVRAQEVDLVGEYPLAHGVTIEVEVGDRVAT